MRSHCKKNITSLIKCPIFSLIPSSDLPVINAATSKMITITLKQLLDIGITGTCEEFPMGELSILPPSGGVTLCPTMNYIKVLLYQLIPAVIIDTILKIQGKRPR